MHGIQKTSGMWTVIQLFSSYQQYVQYQRLWEITTFDWYTTGIWHDGICIMTFFICCVCQISPWLSPRAPSSESQRLSPQLSNNYHLLDVFLCPQYMVYTLKPVRPWEEGRDILIGKSCTFFERLMVFLEKNLIFLYIVLQKSWKSQSLWYQSGGSSIIASSYYPTGKKWQSIQDITLFLLQLKTISSKTFLSQVSRCYQLTT